MATGTLVQIGQKATFRQYFSLTPVVGVTIELTNPAASGKRAQIRRVKFYSLLANQAKLQRTLAAATGGTQAAATPTRSRTETAPVVTAATFSAAPTAGATPTIWDIIENAAAGTSSDGPLTDSETGLVIDQGEFAELLFTVATNSEGYIEWTEETV